jgi:hypothetical protein
VRNHQVQLRLAALVATQAAHSIEEYVGRMWEIHPLARFVSSLFSADLEQGFAIANVALVAFGTWCVLWPVRRRWPSAARFAWLWVIIELANGSAHAAWSLAAGDYRPGLLTAPILAVLALLLARELRNETRDTA